MTDDSDPQDWKPEDGAGYIPTEEGGSQRECVPIEELEALADEWAVKGRGTDLENVCAKELRELIQEYRGDRDDS